MDTQHTDRKQTWTTRSTHRANELFGAVDLTITETLDFDAMTLTSRCKGAQEGVRVDETSTAAINPSVTPEAASRYRAARDYYRIS